MRVLVVVTVMLRVVVMMVRVRSVVMRVVVVIVVTVRKTNLKEPLLFNWCIALCQQIISNLKMVSMVVLLMVYGVWCSYKGDKVWCWCWCNGVKVW